MTSQSQAVAKLAKYKRNRRLGLALALMPLIVLVAWSVIDAVLGVSSSSHNIIESTIHGEIVSIIFGLSIYIAMPVGLTLLLKPLHSNKSILVTRTYLADIKPDQTAVYKTIKATGKSFRLSRLLSAKLIWQKDNQRIYDLQTFSGDKYHSHSYQTIYEAQLQRHLPHIVFNKHILFIFGHWLGSSDYQSDQEIVIDELASAFATFAPAGSKLDVYSFITPEVIEAILALKDISSRIEIIDNQLVCIGKFLDKPRLEIFQALCQNLFFKLNDNLDTRSASQPAALASFAQRLQKPYRHLLVLALILGIPFLAILLPVLVSAFKDPEQFAGGFGIGTALLLMIPAAMPGYCLYLFFKRRRISKQAVAAAKTNKP